MLVVGLWYEVWVEWSRSEEGELPLNHIFPQIDQCTYCRRKKHKWQRPEVHTFNWFFLFHILTFNIFESKILFLTGSWVSLSLFMRMSLVLFLKELMLTPWKNGSSHLPAWSISACEYNDVLFENLIASSSSSFFWTGNHAMWTLMMQIRLYNRIASFLIY